MMALVICLSISGHISLEAKIIYVNGSQIPAIEDGTSWATAYTTLQSALNDAADDDRVWVAQGIYYPVVPADPGNVTLTEQQSTYLITKNIKLFGGFVGNEASLGERDVNTNVTILSGDIGLDDEVHPEDGFSDHTNGFAGKNSFNIMTIANASDVKISGFIFTGGGDHVAASALDKRGGAIDCQDSNVSIDNCDFIANYSDIGGALFIFNSTIEIKFCDFKRNKADIFGGASFIGNSSGSNTAELLFCRFEENESLNRGGGIVCI